MKTKTTKTKATKKPKIELTVKSVLYPKPADRLVQEIMETHAMLEGMKTLYNQMDKLLAEAVAQGLTTTEQFLILDNFKNKDVIFKTTAVKRYELKVR